MFRPPSTSFEQARAMAERQVKTAAQCCWVHYTGKPLMFHSLMGKTGNFYRVRLEWPGILKVLDYQTRELLAVSEPGRPFELASNAQPVQGRAVAEQHLQAAAKLGAAHTEGKPPLYFFLMGPPGKQCLIRVEWPGILRVIDYQTRDLLAESVPGRPDELAGWKGPSGWQNTAQNAPQVG